LLLGEADLDPGSDRVTAITPATNIAAHPEHRFEIDPAVLLAAYKAQRTGGPAILGHYHSHPTGQPIPSLTDAEMAEGRGEYWIIVGSDGAMQGWRADATGSVHARFDPVTLLIRD